MFFSSNQKGQGLIEYAMLLVFVAIVVVAVMYLIGPKVGNIFSSINSSL
ncbi:MAG TPA: Flp family type IVb pilin [Anaerolineales bacterium]|nr:Flp family type IVb pilin [Anaerolineales bacterium]